MEFYDLDVRKIDNLMLATYQKFGYSGICLVKKINLDKQKDLKLEQKSNEMIYNGVSLEANSFGPIRKFIRRYRKKLDLIYVPLRFWAKGSQELIDVFTLDTKLEKRMARRLKEKEIGIEISLNQILQTWGLKRAGLLNKLEEAIKLINKYKLKVIFTSRAENVYDLRAPMDMASILSVLGLKDPIKSVSSNCQFLLKRSKEIRSPKTIMPGVKLK